MIRMNSQSKKIPILPLLIALALVVVAAAGAARAGMSDFNGDGHPDYVLFNRFTRQTAIWHLNNNVFIDGRYGLTIPAGWSVVDVADFDRDGHPDYVLQNANTHQTAIWYLNNNVFTHGAYGPTLPSGWFLGAVGDFNGDGKPDYLLYTQVGSNFPTAIWYMNNNVHVASASGPTLPNGWFLRGVADFNGDGKPDFLLYNALYVLGADNNNRTAIWYLNNNVFVGGRFGPTIPDGWSVVGVADFDRDGHPDYVLNNFNTYRTVIWYLNNNVLTGGAFGPTLPPTSTSSQISWDLVAPLAGGMVTDCAGCWDYP
jgi:FG-GAP-like repeat